ncbi:MAG: 1,4-dihydroxy-6-naphthoate synthase [Mucinivorans sp.]
MRPLQLLISPCPNDTFIFHAMVHKLVECEGVEFDVRFEDIDHLNRLALNSSGDVVKVSSALLPQVVEHYRPIAAGGAMGRGNGPILVSTTGTPLPPKAVVAIAGERTTAALLLRRFFPWVSTRVYLFSDIAHAVISGQVEAGVLIHEGRFVYQGLGLRRVADLGELWEDITTLPIPLGSIVVGRKLPLEVAQAVCRTIRRSVEYGWSHPEASRQWVKNHAQELDEDVRQKHIDFFVNDFSIDIGATGRKALRTLLGCEIELVG